MSKKIVLADDHAIVREGLVSIIKKYTPHDVIADVGDGIQAIEQVRLLKPDLVILDIGMPGLNGLETIKLIRGLHPRVKILVLSVHRNRRFITTSIRYGASGYIIKDGAVEELVNAIDSVLKGRNYISPSLSDVLAEEIIEPRYRMKTRLETLTSRERQVLSLIAGGDSRTEIAGKLHISPETVRSHRKNLMAKLNIHKHSDLVKFALEHDMGPVLPS